MRQLPNATLVVHPRGERHMIDPSRLEASVRAVYGDDEYERQHGTLIGGSDSIQSGVRFGQGKVLCAYAISESANSGAVNTVRRAIVHGYHVNR